MTIALCVTFLRCARASPLLPGFRQGERVIRAETGGPCLHGFRTDYQSGLDLGEGPACGFVLSGFPVIAIGMIRLHVPFLPVWTFRPVLACVRVSSLAGA